MTQKPHHSEHPVFMNSPPQTAMYEGSSKSFRTFIFSQETGRVGVVVIGRV